MTAGPTANGFTPFDAAGGLVFATRLPGSSGDFGASRLGWGFAGVCLTLAVLAAVQVWVFRRVGLL